MSQESEPPIYQVYLYGTVAVIICTACSVCGAAAIPLLNRKSSNMVMLFFMALAVGTLTADSILHLIPEALEIHSHAGLADVINDIHNSTTTHDHDHPHDHEHDHPHRRRRRSASHDHGEHEDKSYFWKLTVIMASIYSLFLFETIAHYFAKLKHSHHHKVAAAPEPKMSFELASSPSDNINSKPIGHTDETDDRKIFGLKPVAFMILFGDSLHKFVDGLVIGAAFHKRLSAGLSTTIAIFCHEVPHELGDFAVLITSGLSVKWALILNCLSSVTAFAGLYVGISVLQALTSVSPWIYAVAGGMFLYISLVDMIPEIRSIETCFSRSIRHFVENFGVLFGMVLIMLISYFEEQMLI